MAIEAIGQMAATKSLKAVTYTVFQLADNTFGHVENDTTIPREAEVIYEQYPDGSEHFFRGATYDLSGDHVHPTLGIFLERIGLI